MTKGVVSTHHPVMATMAATSVGTTTLQHSLKDTVSLWRWSHHSEVVGDEVETWLRADVFFSLSLSLVFITFAIAQYT